MYYGVYTGEPDHLDYFITDGMGSFTHAIKNVALIAWSPDSQYLAYVTGKTNHGSLYLAHGDDSEPVLLSDKAVSGFAWSADSQSLFVGMSGSLYILTLSDKHTERLFTYAVAPVNFAVSPNGKQLSYFVGNSLYLLDTSTHKTKLVGTMPVDAKYRWSPDSQHAFFMTQLNSQMHVYYIMSGDGSKLHRGKPFDGFVPKFTWTPDGKYVWYEEDFLAPSKSLEATTDTILERGDFVAQMVWSRDGKRGVFVTKYPDEVLTIADPAFTSVQQIAETKNLGVLFGVAW